ncbi:MAG TPA: TetR/AcrR family transcriptional regulator [Solirubrobacterales bacterium]|nr:TetR/AcrR family transcriptional regulator [Solirubrobacterales bacterium]
MSSRNCYHLNTRGARTRANRYPPLKPGPGLSAEEVAAHQGKRLHQATVELVAAHGYDAVSVLELSNRARVSKRDFYKLFTGKEECFLASYDTIVSRSVRGVVAAARDADGWRERSRLGFLAFADQVVGSPATAQLALVEAFTAGAVAVERAERANVLFESLLAENFARAGDAPRLPPLVVKGVVAGVSRLAQARLLSDERRRLSLDGNELQEWALSFCDGAAGRLGELDADGVRRWPETVAAMPLEDERELILAATAKLASEEGYATLTVPRVRAAAGVSRRSFDTHFEGVTDCFLATLETLSDRTLAAAAPVYLSAGDWASGVHRMVAGLCSCLARDPTFASLAFLEAFSPCPAAIQWRGETVARLAARLRRDAPLPHKPGQLAAEASIGALWGVIHCFVAAGRGAQLPGAAPVLSYLALAPALGGAAAVEVIAGEGSAPHR